MSERKVLNKYYPPNFDPSRIPKRVIPKDPQHVVRLMTPYSMRCNTCGEYIYKGRKFNARKETVENEHYLSIKIYRFYIRCPMCAAEITYKTDPRNADYQAEHGATRNFEPWRQEQRDGEEARTRRLLEEMNNPMRALENKTFDSKRDLDLAEGLDELRTVNARLDQVDTDRLFVDLSEQAEAERRQKAMNAQREAEADEALVKKLFSKRSSSSHPAGWEDDREAVIVNEEEEEVIEEVGEIKPIEATVLIPKIVTPKPVTSKKTSADLGIILKRRKQ